MKFIITEEQSNGLMEKLLKRKNITYDILYKMNSFDGNHNQYVHGTVYLYQDNKVFGYRHGYDFTFKVGFIKKLEYNGSYPNIEMFDFFKFIPSEYVISFFSEKVKKYLEKGIEEKWISIR